MDKKAPDLWLAECLNVGDLVKCSGVAFASYRSRQRDIIHLKRTPFVGVFLGWSNRTEGRFSYTSGERSQIWYPDPKKIRVAMVIERKKGYRRYKVPIPVFPDQLGGLTSVDWDSLDNGRGDDG